MAESLPPATTVLSVHALSAAYQRRIESGVAGSVKYVLIGTLRRHGSLSALRVLRQIQSPLLLVVYEDVDSEVLVPILKCIAFFTRAKRIELADPSFTRIVQSRTGAIASAWHLVLASIAGFASLCRAKSDTRFLLAAPVVPLVPSQGNNVLYLNSNLWFGVKAGGSVGHIAGVANEMQRRGLLLTYAAVSDSPQIDKAIARHVLRAASSHGIPPELNHYRFGQQVFRQLRTVVLALKPAFIYQRMSICNYTGAQLSRDLGVPLVLEYNGSEVWTAKHWGRPMTFEKVAEDAEQVSLRHAQLIVTVSQALEDQLTRAGVPRDKVVVYPNCVDADVFDSSRFPASNRLEVLSRHNLDADVVIGFIGTFGKWHGVEILAEAIHHLIDDDGGAWLRKHRVAFLIVGDGQGMLAVRNILGSDVSGPFVRLTGLIGQSEAPSYLAACDILVSPHVPNPDGSAFFGSPTKLFEYMSMGKAIVASDLDQIGDVLNPSLKVGSLPEQAPLTGDQVMAVLTTPANVDELIDGIRFLVARTDWRWHLGTNARNEVLARYTWMHHVDVILDRLNGAPKR